MKASLKGPSFLSLMYKPNDTAMSKLVGLPLGIFVKLVMEGRIQYKGVNIAVIPEVYAPVLDELEQFGVVFKDEIRDL